MEGVISSQIVCNPDGQVEYVSGQFFDVTETKNLEEKLRQTISAPQAVTGCKVLLP